MRVAARRDRWSPEEAGRRGNDPDAVRIDGDDDRGGNDAVDTRYGERGDARGVRKEPRREVAAVRRQEEEDETKGRRDSARWGPIWAGLITALTTFLLLQLLAIGIGIVGIGPNDTGGGWVSAILGLIAFFAGGAVAGMTSAVRGAIPGLVNGFLVWALGVVVILLLSSLGVGQIFGALGSVIGQIGVLQNIQQGGVNAPNVDPAQVADAVRTAALGAFFGLLISAVAAMVGGLIGGGPKKPIGYMARERD